MRNGCPLTESRVLLSTTFKFSSTPIGTYIPQHFLLRFTLPPFNLIYSPNVQGSLLIGMSGTRPPEHRIESSLTLQLNFIPNPLAPLISTSWWVSVSVNPMTWVLGVLFVYPFKFRLYFAKLSWKLTWWKHKTWGSNNSIKLTEKNGVALVDLGLVDFLALLRLQADSRYFLTRSLYESIVPKLDKIYTSSTS